jgi:hypothetical protein
MNTIRKSAEALLDGRKEVGLEVQYMLMPRHQITRQISNIKIADTSSKSVANLNISKLH